MNTILETILQQFTLEIGKRIEANLTATIESVIQEQLAKLTSTQLNLDDSLVGEIARKLEDDHDFITDRNIDEHAITPNNYEQYDLMDEDDTIRKIEDMFENSTFVDKEDLKDSVRLHLRNLIDDGRITVTFN